jgi:tight adherence protein B
MHAILILAQDVSFEQIGLYALPLIGSTMLAFAIYNLVTDLRRSDAKKIAERLKESSGRMAAEGSITARESIIRRNNAPTTAISTAVSNLRLVNNVQVMLEQANLPWSAPSFILNVIGLGAVGFIACYFVQVSTWIGISVAAALVILPFVAVFVMRGIRLNKFMRQLPDVFELMSQALRAGHSLANAILLVGQQLPDPVGTEFSRVFHEQNLGIKIEDALKGMARRIGLMDVRFFVTAVLIQRQTGGDLAEVLDNISFVIRDRIKLFGQVKALTAEGRLSGWVLLALPIVVFIMELVVNPEYANVLLDEPVGQYMLIGAGVAQLLGLAMIQKIVNIKV